MTHDWLIAGAGFAGSTMARLLAEAGERVLIIDKRDHIGGNAYDYVNEHGVRIHKYGPHIFHTNSKAIFGFLSRFTQWRFYEHRVLASVDGKLVPFPINIDTVNQLYGLHLDAPMMKLWLDNQREPMEEIKNAEDQVVAQCGRGLFETFFAGYTRKMWGVEARDLDKSVTARIPIRTNHDDRYFTDAYQFMPKDGYTALFERMLDHSNITTLLDEGARNWWLDKKITGIARMVWTGPIDEYFGHCFGQLPYRSMRFAHNENPNNPDWQTRATTINFPSADVDCTRMTSMNRLANDDWRTDPRVCFEYPCAEGEPFYPIPAPANRALYERYRALADKEPNVTFLGRLGTYQYLNMDQAVGQAMAAFRRLKERQPRTI